MVGFGLVRYDFDIGGQMQLTGVAVVALALHIGTHRHESGEGCLGLRGLAETPSHGGYRVKTSRRKKDERGIAG